MTLEQQVRHNLQRALDGMRKLPPDVSEQIHQEFQEDYDEMATTIQDQEKRRYKRTRFSEMSKPLPDRTWVRHEITPSDVWSGVWNAQKGVLECNVNGEIYEFEYPSTFCKTHFKTTRNDRTPNTNAWGKNTCQVYIEGEWVSLHLYR